jgi:hypothetical protein
MFGTGRLEKLAGLEEWVASVATQQHSFGRIRIYVLDLTYSDSDFAVARFGEAIELRGHTISSSKAQSGDMLTLMLFWQSSKAVPADYHVSVRLLSEEGYLYGQHDGVPGMGKQPTNQWIVGQEVFDIHSIEVGQGAPPGRYRLSIGMYSWPSLERLPASRPDGDRWSDDQVLLEDVLVVLP